MQPYLVFLIPLLTSILNVKRTDMFDKLGNTIMYDFLLINFLSDVMTSIVTNYFLFESTNEKYEKMKLNIMTARLKCGIEIPAHEETKYNDLINDNFHKIRDYLFVKNITINTVLSFAVSIFVMNSWIFKVFITILMIFAVFLMTYFTNIQIYEKIKDTPSKIIEIKDHKYVKIRLHGKSDLHPYLVMDQLLKQRNQVYCQKICVILFNLIVVYLSMIYGTKVDIINITCLSWLLGFMSDNLKNFSYRDTMNEYDRLHKYFTTNEYQGTGNVELTEVNEIKFDRVTFSYVNSNAPIILNLSYTFRSGLYFISGPNGVGKSTLFKLFMYNIDNGNIYFDGYNRNVISFKSLQKMIYYLPQSSEYSPKFPKMLMDAVVRDEELINDLDVSEFFVNTGELSGGQRQRMNIYMALTSKCPIIFFDESLSELSCQKTDKYPMGYRNAVISAIIKQSKKGNKIIICVGHGYNIPKAKNLTLVTVNGNTVLTDELAEHTRSD